MVSMADRLSEILHDENVKGLNFQLTAQFSEKCRKAKHDIEVCNDGIIFTEKKGGKNVVVIPFHSSFIYVVK